MPTRTGPPTLGALDALCTCRHSWAIHQIGTRGGVKIRTTCSAGGPTGPCGCRRYQRNEGTDQ